MTIDMKGYDVVYGDKIYECIAVEPIIYTDYDESEHIDKLRVFIVDHDTGFNMIMDDVKNFSFLGVPKIA